MLFYKRSLKATGVFRVELQYSYLRAKPQLEKQSMNFDGFSFWIFDNKEIIK